MRNILLLIAAISLYTSGYAQEKATVSGIDVHLSVTEVRPGGGDTLWLRLDGGANLGLQKGAKGTAVQVYKSKERDYKTLSSVTVTGILSASATAYVLAGDADKAGYLLTGDQVVFNKLALPTFGAEDNYVLRSLAAFNIRFADQSAIPFYQQLRVLKGAKNSLYDSLLQAFQKDIIETATYLRTEIKDIPKAWTDPFKVGKYKGLGLLSAMEKTSLADVESFLHFVMEYPGKYIGRQWKLNETYATWLINDMPPPSDKSYFARSYLRLPKAETARWVRENSYYYDTTRHYLTAMVDKAVANQQDDSASLLLASVMPLAEAVKDHHFISYIYTNQGYLLQKKGKADHAAAISLYNKALALDTTNWAAYWYRGNLYGDMDRLDDAIRDMQAINRLYPYYSYAWGNQGWWYLKQFKVKEAGAACKKAYELDSSVYAWSVNLAHYYVLSGQNAKARAAYQKTLDNLTSQGEFLNGALSDFDFFAERGLLAETFAQEKAWLLKEYNSNYQHYLQADSLFRLAKQQNTAENYKEAVELFKKSRDAEKAAAIKRELYIHNITTWIGFAYLQMKDYKQAETYYTEALADAQQHFPQQVANDLELVAELNKKKGNHALSEAYYARAAAWKNKAASSTATQDLHIVSIGIDQYNDIRYQWAATDAQKVAYAFRQKGAQFANVHSYVLTNQQAVSDSVDKTMQRIISQAKEEDAFVFYFTGKALTSENTSFLLPYGLPSEQDSVLKKKAISAQLLRSWSNSIPSRRQFFLLDAPASNFSSAFANHATSLIKTALQKDVVMVGAAFPRIEEQERGSSVMAAALLQLYSDSSMSTEKIITGKKIESHFADAITRNNYFLSLETYSQGRDFVLAESERREVAGNTTLVQKIVSNNFRGTVIDNVSESGTYKLNKKYGLFIATDIYKDPKWSRLNNPISDAAALKAVLESEYGFEIEVLENPTKSAIMRKIDEYSRKKFEKNDQLVILFAGHGYYDARRNEGYLVPTDAVYTEIEFDQQYYPMSALMRDLKIIPAQHMLVLMDACHGGAICENALMRGEGDDLYGSLSLDQLVKSHLEYPNRVILTSGRKDQRVPDGVKGRNSPFIAAIKDALQSEEARKKGTISYYQLMKSITDRQKTQATSAIFSPQDNWNFMFFYGGGQKSSPIGDPTGSGGN